MGGGDVQEHHLVRARIRIGGRHLYRIPGIPEVEKIGALHHPAVLNIQTGDDPFRIHRPHPSFPDAARVISTKLRSSRWPVSPDFSGWNCIPITLPRCTALWKGRPYSVVVSTSSGRWASQA